MAPPARGVLAVARSYDLAFVRVSPASTHVPLGLRIDDWKSQRHVVEKAALSRAIRRELALRLPEDATDPSHAADRAMLAATTLLVVDDALRDELVAWGIRVWTIGYHRNPAILRVAAIGGPGASVRIEQSVYGILQRGADPRPVGRPASAGWSGSVRDFDFVDRVLRAASGDAFGEDDVLLADAIVRLGWTEHLRPRAERRADVELVEMIERELERATEEGWADARWNGLPARLLEEPSPPAASVALAKAVAGDDGPDEVDVDGLGRFWRERLWPVDLRLAPESTHGWFPPVSALPEALPGRLALPAVHRYARTMPPGPWWDLSP